MKKVLLCLNDGTLGEFEEFEYHVVEGNAFLDFLLRPECKVLMKVIMDVSFTSDKWLLQSLDADNIGWDLSIADLEVITKLDEDHQYESFMELLEDNHIAYHSDEYDGYSITFRTINDSDYLHISTVFNQLRKANKNYSQLSNYFK